jgi:hypothetical protein
MKQEYDQIKIPPSDMKRLNRDNPQGALFENLERGADSAQIKTNTHRTRCWRFSRSGKVQITCHIMNWINCQKYSTISLLIISFSAFQKSTIIAVTCKIS